MNFSLALPTGLACASLCVAALLVGFLAGYSVGFLASSFKLLDFTDWSDTQGAFPTGNTEQDKKNEHKKGENKVDNKEKVE